MATSVFASLEEKKTRVSRRFRRVMDASRTVVVSGVPDPLPGHRMRDKLTVHFQSRRRSRGGDVDVVQYPTDVRGVAFVTFDHAADAETVALKEQQILTDAEFPGEYLLTVFPFTTDVFFYVSATVDLSMFAGDQESSIRGLRSAHRSLRFQTLPRERKATVEGPFSAVRALGEDLTSRARRLKPAGVKLGEVPPNPRVISHRGLAGPVSRSDSQAKREPGGSSGLSAPLQSTGEGSEVQSRRSNAGAPNPARQKAQSFCDAGAEEALKAGPEPRLTSGHGTERAQAKATRRDRDDVDPRDAPKQPPVNGAVQKRTTTDWDPATKARTRLDSHNSTDCLKESHQSPAVTAKTRPKDVPASYVDEARAGKTDGPEDTCIWVDSYIFRYIEKFDHQYKRCRRGLNASVEEAEGSDLVRIRLAETDPCEGPSGVQQTLAKLNTLVERWQSTLRVHEISFNKQKHPKEEVIMVCIDVARKYNYDNVLYMVDESKVKIVGPLSFSYLFYLTVKQRLEWDSI